jgi:hypothetical protein
MNSIHIYVRFEVSTAVTMKNDIFFGVMPCVSCDNRCFGGTCRLHHQGEKDQRASNKVSNGIMLRTHVAQGIDQWPALVKTVM